MLFRCDRIVLLDNKTWRICATGITGHKARFTQFLLRHKSILWFMRGWILDFGWRDVRSITNIHAAHRHWHAPSMISMTTMVHVAVIHVRMIHFDNAVRKKRPNKPPVLLYQGGLQMWNAEIVEVRCPGVGRNGRNGCRVRSRSRSGSRARTQRCYRKYIIIPDAEMHWEKTQKKQSKNPLKRAHTSSLKMRVGLCQWGVVDT